MDVAQALAGIEPGTQITLKMADGTEVKGRLAGVKDDIVSFSDRDEGAAAGEVADVMVQVLGDGPE